MWQGIKNIYHLGNAVLANVWFGFPSRGFTVVGVTGTDGKTTTTSLIYHILNTAGYNTSMISSVGATIGGKEYDVGFHVTTPSPWALQGFIKKAVDSPNDTFEKFDTKLERVRHSGEDSERMRGGRLQNLFAYSMAQGDSGQARMTMSKMSYLVLETTSHALDQHRVWGIKFDIGVLTNITHEHLDYHKTYENYVMTKMKLLQKSKISVLNKDDSSYKLISSKLKTQNSKLQLKTQKLITYGMNETSKINPKNFPFKTNLIGEFNRYNVLAAIAACRSLGINDESIREAILTFKPPIGRGEIVYPSAGSGQVNFTVMVDFAHTPNAFEEILSAVKPSIKGRLIHVFGAAGERDASKRQLMGKVSAKYSDIIILTAEDPRSESVDKIMEEISKEIFNFQFSIFNETSKINFKFEKGKKYLFKIADRQEAITAAIRMARKGDFVLITGKSHEKSMNYGKGEELWDEFEVVREALGNLPERSPRRSPSATSEVARPGTVWHLARQRP